MLIISNTVELLECLIIISNSNIEFTLPVSQICRFIINFTDSPKVMIGTGDGPAVEVDWVRSEELPDESPDVAGVYERRQDNSIFVDETEGGFRLAQAEDGSISVTNATGKISEIVVTSGTTVHVDMTMEDIDDALAEGVVRQKLEPGTVEEIGDLSFVRAWGEMRGDRLIASVLVYNRPPVISR